MRTGTNYNTAVQPKSRAQSSRRGRPSRSESRTKSRRNARFPPPSTNNAPSAENPSKPFRQHESETLRSLTCKWARGTLLRAVRMRENAPGSA